MKKFDNTKPAKLLVEVCSELLPGIALDMGCGKGKNALWLAQYGWEVDAVEPKSEWLELAQKRAQDQNIKDISFTRSDIESYETNKQYDLVLCAMVLHFLPKESIQPVIKKIKSWVKVGGVIYISVMTDQNPAESRPTLFRKGQLKSCFSDWEVDRSYRLEAEPLHMPDKTQPQAQHFEYLVARKLG